MTGQRNVSALVMGEKDALMKMSSAELKAWGQKHFSDEKEQETFKKVMHNLGVDMDSMPAEGEDEALSAAKYKIVLHTDAKSRHSSWCICASDGTPLVVHADNDASDDHGENQAMLEMKAAREAVEYASEVRDEARLGSLLLVLYTDQQSLCHAVSHDKPLADGDSSKDLGRLAKERGLELEVLWNASGANPADRHTTMGKPHRLDPAHAVRLITKR